MSYEFYIHEIARRPFVSAEDGLPHLPDLMQVEITGGRTAKAILEVLDLVASGDLGFFTWGGDAAFLEIQDNSIEVQHESFDRPSFVEISLEELRAVLTEWADFLEENGWGERGDPQRVWDHVEYCRKRAAPLEKSE